MFKIIEARTTQELTEKMSEHMTQFGQALLGAPFYAEGMFYQAFRTEMNLEKFRELTAEPDKVEPVKVEPDVTSREYLLGRVDYIMDLALDGDYVQTVRAFRDLHDRVGYVATLLARAYPDLDKLIFTAMKMESHGYTDGKRVEIGNLVAALRSALPADRERTPVPKSEELTPTQLDPKAMPPKPPLRTLYDEFNPPPAHAKVANAPESTADRLERAHKELQWASTPAGFFTVILDAIREGFPEIAIDCFKQATINADALELLKGVQARYGGHLDGLLFEIMKARHKGESSELSTKLEDLYTEFPEFRPTINLTKEKK